ncbi:MAG: hypothetical protein JO353_12480, partial [Phycisphaerae bacterium]|nr:hypothetical protein [Phycisphaerae bacterium]
RLRQAVDAAIRLIPNLPPSDSVRIGDFSDNLHWWADETAASNAAAFAAPLLEAHGPTNLQHALIGVVNESTTPTEVLLLSDADVTLNQPDQLAKKFTGQRTRVDLLALTDRPPNETVAQLVQNTGGKIVESADPRRWSDDLRNMAVGIDAIPQHHQLMEVRYLPAAGLNNRTVNEWNSTWPKSGAIVLTENDPRTARWMYGTGAVGAISFSPTLEELAAFRRWLAIPAREPDFSVDWDDGSPSLLTIDATHGDAYRNDLQLTVTIGNTPSIAVPLVVPGRYRIAIPSQREPALAVVRQANRILDRHVIAGRYPPEFDHIGNNLPALQSFADSSGGSVISPTQHGPIDFHWPAKTMPLSSYFATAGALLIATACWVKRI